MDCSGEAGLHDRSGQEWKERTMSIKRILLEVGTGNDWHSQDYTKAAVRAVHPP